jgi:hypothetical protein
LEFGGRLLRSKHLRFLEGTARAVGILRIRGNLQERRKGKHDFRVVVADYELEILGTRITKTQPPSPCLTDVEQCGGIYVFFDFGEKLAGKWVASVLGCSCA